MIFIGSSWKYTAPDMITTGRTYRITARVFPCRPGLKLQVVQDDPEVLGDEATVPLAFTWQDVSLDVVAISADPIVLRCNESLMLVDRLEITEAVLPGLEIINFRYLPESVKESVIAANFSGDSPTISVAGITMGVGKSASLPFDHDHYHMVVEFASLGPNTLSLFVGPGNRWAEGIEGVQGGGGVYAAGGVVILEAFTGLLRGEIVPIGSTVHASGSDGSAFVAGEGAEGAAGAGMYLACPSSEEGGVSVIKSFLLIGWDDPEA